MKPLYPARFILAQTLSGQDTREIARQWANFWADRYGVQRELVRAVIEIESGWNPRAVSPKGALGLMQLMPSTARRFGVEDRFDIAQNTRGGAAYLAHLLGLFGGDWRLAVAAYYTGENRILPRGLAFADRDVYRYVSATGRVYLRLCRDTQAGTDQQKLMTGGSDAISSQIVLRAGDSNGIVVPGRR